MAKHPDEEISEKYRESMNALAHALDEMFNGDKTGIDRTVSFVLLVGDFGVTERVNYISNSERSDIIAMMKEIVARFEGQPEMKGHA
jgi:hypothetical protein